jgi:hypothetical protein
MLRGLRCLRATSEMSLRSTLRSLRPQSGHGSRCQLGRQHISRGICRRSSPGSNSGCRIRRSAAMAVRPGPSCNVKQGVAAVTALQMPPGAFLEAESTFVHPAGIVHAGSLEALRGTRPEATGLAADQRSQDRADHEEAQIPRKHARRAPSMSDPARGHDEFDAPERSESAASTGDSPA